MRSALTIIRVPAADSQPAMSKTSAGILLYRTRRLLTEVLLVHPGGPFWAGKDVGSWSVPKGIVEFGEHEFECARREFREETGFEAPNESKRDLGTFRLSSSKTARVWALKGDLDAKNLVSNTFEIEWPPKSGEMRRFPEVDRGQWFDQSTAIARIVKGQRPILEAFYGSI